MEFIKLFYILKVGHIDEGNRFKKCLSIGVQDLIYYELWINFFSYGGNCLGELLRDEELQFLSRISGSRVFHSTIRGTVNSSNSSVASSLCIEIFQNLILPHLTCVDMCSLEDVINSHFSSLDSLRVKIEHSSSKDCKINCKR